MEPISGNVFAAEYILKDRTRKGKTEYLIKWKGWNSRWNSWEPVENVLDPRLLDEYNERKNKPKPARGKKGAAKRPASKAGSSTRPTRAAKQRKDDEEDNSDEDQPGPSKDPEESETNAKKEEEMEQKESSEKSEVSGQEGTDPDSGKEKLTQRVEPLKRTDTETTAEPVAQSAQTSVSASKPEVPQALTSEHGENDSSSSSSTDDSDSEDSEDDAAAKTTEPAAQNQTEIQAAGDSSVSNGPQDLSAHHNKPQEYPLPGTPSPPNLTPLETQKQPPLPVAHQPNIAGMPPLHPSGVSPAISVPSCHNGEQNSDHRHNLAGNVGPETGGMRKVVCGPEELQFPNHNSQIVTTVEGVTIVENLRANP